jgi:cytochrome c biogenesis protein CcdA
LQNKADSLGIGGAGLLGIVFALSFCPTSAAIFFGSLLPLAVQQQSGLLIPGIYGLATGLPVLFFALLLAFGANKVAQAFNRITAFEIWARRITGLLFVLIGGYYCAVHLL